MFFGLFALIACQKTTVTRQVKMPVIPPVGSMDISQENETNCPWEYVNLSLFNQKAQRVQFRYRNCKHAPKTFRVADGHKIFMLQKIDYIPDATFNVEIMRIEKLGPETPMTYMKSLLPKGSLESGLCEIVKLDDKVWRLKSNFEPDINLLFDKAERIGVAKLPPDPCGDFATYPGKIFAFEQGIVFSVGGEGVGQILDLSSVVYEING